MALFRNELGEFYNPEDFEPPINPFEKYRDLHPAMHGYDERPTRTKQKPRRCEECHEVYEPSVPHQKYCSDECRKQARRRRNGSLPTEEECPICHKKFMASGSRVYCSDGCYKLSKKLNRRIGAIGAALAVAAFLLCGCTADAVERTVDAPLAVMDVPAPKPVPATGTVESGFAGIVPAYETEPEPEPEPEHEYAEQYCGPADDAGYAVSGTYYAEYSELYNTDGPSHDMPGWHDGYLETYYNASAHYLADTWEVDDEGFYRTTDGLYVVGVDINDVNPETGEQYRYGDIVETGRGDAVVYDYGSGAHVHDFATVW